MPHLATGPATTTARTSSTDAQRNRLVRQCPLCTHRHFSRFTRCHTQPNPRASTQLTARITPVQIDGRCVRVSVPHQDHFGRLPVSQLRRSSGVGFDCRTRHCVNRPTPIQPARDAPDGACINRLTTRTRPDQVGAPSEVLIVEHSPPSPREKPVAFHLRARAQQREPRRSTVLRACLSLVARALAPHAPARSAPQHIVVGVERGQHDDLRRRGQRARVR